MIKLTLTTSGADGTYKSTYLELDEDGYDRLEPALDKLATRVAEVVRELYPLRVYDRPRKSRRKKS